MAKIKKYSLTFDNEINYDLIGINSYHPDYRLVWNLNNTLSFYLEKSDNFYEISDKKGNINYFPYYFYKNEEEFIDIYLIKNKYLGETLIPEKNQIDYFLFICNNFVIDINDCVNKLRKIDSVMLAMSFNVNELNSTKNLILN